MSEQDKRLLFVCMGNICRSPTAHAVMHHKIQSAGLASRISIDSAGTHAYHVGEPSDARSRALATQRGIDMEWIRARQLAADDYDHFDHIYAMDEDNLRLIKSRAPIQHRARVELFLAPAQRAQLSHRRSVPDPYYGGAQGFEDVFELVELGCDAILSELGVHRNS